MYYKNGMYMGVCMCAYIGVRNTHTQRCWLCGTLWMDGNQGSTETWSATYIHIYIHTYIHTYRIAELEHRISLLVEENKCSTVTWSGGGGGISELQLENERLAKEVYVMSKELAKVTSLGVASSWLDRYVCMHACMYVCMCT